MNRGVALLSIALGAGLQPSGAADCQAFDIAFDYQYDTHAFFSAPERRAALERAGSILAEQLAADLEALPHSEWMAVFPHPSGAAIVERGDLSVARDSILVFVGAAPRDAASPFARGAPGSWRFPCIDLLSPRDCFESLLGFHNPEVANWIERRLFRGNPMALEYPPRAFAPWGGSLRFATDVPWYFGAELPVPADHYDFLSFAIHELGHVLGIGTAESWTTQVHGNEFLGERAGAQRIEPVELSGDASHWADGTMSRSRNEPAVPVFLDEIPSGRRRLLTDLDRAALWDIGWGSATSNSVGSRYERRRIKGDINGDGSVDAGDAESLRAHFERPWIDTLDRDQADVSPCRAYAVGDGAIDARDAELAARAAELARHGPALLEGRRLPQFLRDPATVWSLRYDALDLEAICLLGWTLPPLPDPLPRVLDPPPPIPTANPRAGDFDHDGILSERDADAVKLLYRVQAFDHPEAWEAADVFPMIEGTSVGDSLVDENDWLLLEAAVEDPNGDPDGDGHSNAAENARNQMWMIHVGRPRHEPLVRWTEACLPPLEHLEPEEFVRGNFRFEFCGRDGTPWARGDAISPEEYLAQRARNEGASPSSLDVSNASDSSTRSSTPSLGGNFGGMELSKEPSSQSAVVECCAQSVSADAATTTGELASSERATEGAVSRRPGPRAATELTVEAATRADPPSLTTEVPPPNPLLSLFDSVIRALLAFIDWICGVGRGRG